MTAHRARAGARSARPTRSSSSRRIRSTFDSSTCTASANQSSTESSPSPPKSTGSGNACMSGPLFSLGSTLPQHIPYNTPLHSRTLRLLTAAKHEDPRWPHPTKSALFGTPPDSGPEGEGEGRGTGDGESAVDDVVCSFCWVCGPTPCPLALATQYALVAGESRSEPQRVRASSSRGCAQPMRPPQETSGSKRQSRSRCCDFGAMAPRS
jgi:hypothetical protein